MIAKASALTNAQTDALAEFEAGRRDTTAGVMRWAHAYKTCIDLGMDMSERVPSQALAHKLLAVARGNLIPIGQMEFLMLPAPLVTALETFPVSEQQRIWKEGVDVLRDGKTVRAPFIELSANEVRRVIDTTDGKGRIVPPAEQAKRAVPAVPRHDKVIKARLNYEQSLDFAAYLHKSKMSEDAYLKKLLKKEGIIK